MFASLGHLRITFLVPNLLISTKKMQGNLLVGHFKEAEMNEGRERTV